MVLLNSNGKTGAGAEGTPVATLCTDVLPAPKYAKPRDWLTLLRPLSVSIRPSSPLRFSLSLNDVGQRVDSLCRGLRFIDRTCSEGELERKAEPASLASSERNTQTLNGKLAPAPAHSMPSPQLFVPSLNNNYRHMLAPSPAGLELNRMVPPLLSSQQPHSQCPPSSSFLRVLFPFSHSPTSASLRSSELAGYASYLHITRSSSALEDRDFSFPIEEMLGDEDTGEEEQLSGATKAEDYKMTPATVTRAGAAALQAPLCYMDEDSDLDPCPLTEKSGPQSPYSLSGDCCRWVTGCLGGLVHTHPSCGLVEPRTPSTWQFRVLWSAFSSSSVRIQSPQPCLTLTPPPPPPGLKLSMRWS